jgi:energy-coupling factor transporter ATP-binding protein EcfA2
MRVTEICVAGLFGVFDHRIPLRTGERITLIHGPNGFGKTVILRMVAGLFRGTYGILQTIPFKLFALRFDDGSELRIEKEARPRPSAEPARARRKRALPDFTAQLIASDGTITRSFTPTPKDDIRWRRIRDYVAHFAQREGLTHSSPWEWREPATGEILTMDALYERYAEMLPLRPDETLPMFGPDQAWFEEFRKKIDVRLIRAQRLEALRREPGQERSQSVPTVRMYSDEIAATMQRVFTEYAAKSQELDRTFPPRLFRQAGPWMSTPDLERKLAQLEQKRAWLTDLGFLEPEPGLTKASRQEIDKKADVLTIYVADVEQKLGAFDELASKVSLLSQIINARFRYKRMRVHRDRGFAFTSATNAPLDPTDLSSGEQHELVLLYELLFKTSSNALVLIDEPEISLHIAWQEEFLNDLQKIVQTSGFDVLIATHSPEIIGDHMSLAVELKGPVEDFTNPSRPA